MDANWTFQRPYPIQKPFETHFKLLDSTTESFKLVWQMVLFGDIRPSVPSVSILER